MSPLPLENLRIIIPPKEILFIWKKHYFCVVIKNTGTVKLLTMLLILRSRGRSKSAPYPRLKNSKKTSKCQVFSFTVLENRKFYEKNFSKKLHTQKNGPSGAPGPASASPWRAERGTLPKLSTFLSQLKGFCRKTSKK